MALAWELKIKQSMKNAVKGMRGSYTFQGMALANAHKSIVPKKHNEITKKFKDVLCVD